mgnify:CR=1 FL=1|tara:strand:- start:181 stop:384 length:204 start_codon:yes stop_codon:yes gene_type:complete
MACETVYKKLKLGTLVLINRLNEYGIVVKAQCAWSENFADDPFCYVIFVKGREVKACKEGLTVVGEF